MNSFEKAIIEAYKEMIEDYAVAVAEDGEVCTELEAADVCEEGMMESVYNIIMDYKASL